jgi:hypothetical protein
MGLAGATKVLVFGSVRSGTTWTAEILAATESAQLVNEPDTVSHNDYALKALSGLDVDPLLGPDDPATRPYEQLWDALFGDGPPRRMRGRNWLARRLLRDLSVDARRSAVRPDGRLSARHRIGVALTQPPRVDPSRPVVVKTVAALHALDWVLARWQPVPIWVRRHPLDVVASRMSLPFQTQADLLWSGLHRAGQVPPWCPAPPRGDVVAVASWLAGVGLSACRDVAERRPDVLVVEHEVLCRDPPAEFRALAAGVGLVWTDASESVLAASNRPGDGWTTKRITAEQPGKWRTRLTREQQRTAIEWLARFPIARDYEELQSVG